MKKCMIAAIVGTAVAAAPKAPPASPWKPEMYVPSFPHPPRFVRPPLLHNVLQRPTHY